MRAALSIALLAATFAAAAQGPLRTIPAEAKRAGLRHLHDLVVEVDGVRRQLAPGAQIRDESNRILLPTNLPALRDVRFTEDPDGRIRQVWILAPQEAQERR
jgi:hypothetical protein